MKFLTATALLFALAAPAMAQDGTTIAVQQSDEYGAYLATEDGQPVYMFTTDTPASDGQDSSLTCDDDCMEVWPLVTTTGDPQAGDGVDAEMLGTAEYEGQQVVT